MKLRMFSIGVTALTIVIMIFNIEGASGTTAGMIFLLELAAGLSQIVVLLRSLKAAPFSEPHEKRMYLSVCVMSYLIVATVFPVTELTKTAAPAILAVYVITFVLLILKDRKDKMNYPVLAICIMLSISYLSDKIPL